MLRAPRKCQPFPTGSRKDVVGRTQLFHLNVHLFFKDLLFLCGIAAPILKCKVHDWAMTQILLLLKIVTKV